MNRWKVLIVLAIVSLFAASLGAASSKETVWPADAIKWEKGPAPGTHLAALWGDATKGAFGVLVKFDGGVMHPMHKHTNTLKIVVISGTFVYQPKGGKETRLGPGSYLVQPGGKWHVSGCAAGAECEFFMTGNGKFDLIPEKK
jgi:quercetin dioxygenase-like cupin family protein